MLLLPAVLLAALAAGAFAAFAGSQMKPVFFHPNDLRAKLDLPILGIVSAVLGDADERRQRIDRLRFLAASSSLVLLFAGGLAVMSIMAGR